MTDQIDIGSLTIDQAQELMDQLRNKLGQIKSSIPHTYTKALKRDYASWDWTKKNKELAAEHGVNYITVVNWRNKLGKPKVCGGKHYPACLSWDWTLPDAEIARQNGVVLSSVQGWRRNLNKPAAPKDFTNVYAGTKAATSRIDFSNVDWSITDSEIARTLGCTREFVRQKRAEFKKPKVYSWDNEYRKFVEAFAGRESLTLNEAREVFPTLADSTFLKRCGKAGIKVFRRPMPEKIHHWSGMNFQLPNKLLGEIWNAPVQQVGTYRSNHSFGRALFQAVGNRIPEQFLPMVEAERAKAKSWFESKAA